MTETTFDYEAKLWGMTSVVAKPWSLQGLKLRYCLEDLAGVSGSIVDVGCGGGNMARAIKRERPDLEVHGVDVSRSAIVAARGVGGGVTFDVAEATTLPFDDSSMDAVTMFDVLEHLADPPVALAEIARVLKIGGLFHIALPLEGQPGTIHRFLRSRGWDATLRQSGHVQAFSEDDFRRLAAQHSLPVTRVRWSYHYLFSLIDVLYYTFLQRRGGMSISAGDFVSSRRGWAAAPMRAVWGMVSALGWYEARAFRWMRGECGHFTCLRRA
jgi:SAM-dependent methyltransferase